MYVCTFDRDLRDILCQRQCSEASDVTLNVCMYVCMYACVYVNLCVIYTCTYTCMRYVMYTYIDTCTCVYI